MEILLKRVSLFNSYLAQHFSKVVQKNRSVTDNIINTSEGYICHSNIEEDDLKKYISDISAVKVGYPFLCYSGNNINTTTVIDKSYVNYIVISIILFTDCIYPLAMDMAFYIEDRKIRQGFYFLFFFLSLLTVHLCFVNEFFSLAIINTSQHYALHFWL